MMSLSQYTHSQRVRLLYKSILRLHKGLPDNLKDIGNGYVKEEFRRHKTANETQTAIFMQEWTKYFVTLAKQLGKGYNERKLGQQLSGESLDKFTNDQIQQLYELYSEIHPKQEEKH